MNIVGEMVRNAKRSTRNSWSASLDKNLKMSKDYAIDGLITLQKYKINDRKRQYSLHIYEGG